MMALPCLVLPLETFSVIRFPAREMSTATVSLTFWSVHMASTLGGGNVTGAAYLFIGRPTTFKEVFDLSDLGGRRMIRLDGIGNGNQAGVSDAAAGDVNGDGFHDVIVGARYADPGGRSQAGTSYVVFGRGDDGFPQEIDLADLDGSDGFAINGVSPNDRSGISVSSAGDIDSDGFDDLIIGAFDANGGTGAAYLVYGSPEYVQGLTRFGTDKANKQLNGKAVDDVILGLNGGDNIDGRGGSDTLFGGFGPDSILGSGGSDRLFGGQGKDTLAGGGGDDNLFGNSGTDDMDGGDGNDLLNGGTGPDDLKGGGGNDLLEGSADDDMLDGGPGGDSLMGNQGDDLLIGGSGNDALNGGKGDDELLGGPGKDQLTGGEGNDLLNGGGGADTMRGGLGNDTFIVAQSSDRVIEANGNGTDLVRTSVAFDLGENIENLVIAGKADLDGNGNSLANEITGNGGKNRLDGKGGNDNLSGKGGDDDLIGGSGRDNLEGGDGNDTLNGGPGNDTMRGNAGDDTYIVVQSGDRVIETSGNGTDLVESLISYSLGNNLENLLLTGNADSSGDGNNIVNEITGNSGANRLDGKGGNDRIFGEGGDDELLGGSGKDRLDGAAGNDELFGGGDNDQLFGGPGRDLLDGGSGGDTMSGGGGNDSYLVDSGSDKVIEAENGGTDLVTSSVGYSLDPNVEKLTLTGSGSIDASGNGTNNTIRGNNGANEIDGGPGNDIMTGRGDKDIFILGKNSGDDRITDFESGEDKLDLTAYSFTTGAQVLSNAKNSQNDVLIELDNNNSVRLSNLSKSDLKAGDFIVNEDDEPPDKIDLPSTESGGRRSIDIDELTIDGIDLDLGLLGQPGGGATLQSYCSALPPEANSCWFLDFADLDAVG